MLRLSTHTAVEMFHDSVLYKFTINIDIYSNVVLQVNDLQGLG